MVPRGGDRTIEVDVFGSLFSRHPYLKVTRVRTRVRKESYLEAIIRGVAIIDVIQVSVSHAAVRGFSGKLHVV